MSSFKSRSGATLALFAFSCSIAAAQNPTFSLEAVAINGVKLPGGPTAKVSVSPGATILYEVYVRDWSPAGEKNRAYQVQLDIDGYTSGLAGTIKPMDFESRRLKQEENREHCYVDTAHPKFVYRGLQNMGIADTRSRGYRWLGMLLHDGDALGSDQKGEKFYCGTVRMKVSADAQGTFRPRLLPGAGNTTLRDVLSRAILPVDIENASVEIVTGELAIVSSDPPRGSIDARASARGGRGGWQQVSLQFSGDTASLSASDFTVTDGSTNPPKIIAISSEGTVIRLQLNRGIATGRWTNVFHRQSATETRIGRLPGDANSDGEIDTRDLMEVLASLVADTDESTPQFDVTDDGNTNLADALSILSILTQTGAYRNEHLELDGR